MSVSDCGSRCVIPGCEVWSFIALYLCINVRFSWKFNISVFPIRLFSSLVWGVAYSWCYACETSGCSCHCIMFWVGSPPVWSSLVRLGGMAHSSASLGSTWFTVYYPRFGSLEVLGFLCPGVALLFSKLR